MIVAGAADAGAVQPLPELALHLLDLVRNSIEAGASNVAVTVDERPGAGVIALSVTDNGRGMDDARIAHVLGPEAAAGRSRAGAPGLVRLHAAAEAADGRLAVCSVAGGGTRVRAVFGAAHPARPPLGDLETTVLVLMASHPDLDLDWTHRRGGRDYSLATADVRTALDGVPLASPAGLSLLRAAVRSGERALAGTAASPAGTEDQP